MWGLPLYLVGILLIVVGLKPHQKLKQLENNPNVIFVDQNLMLTFKSKGLEIFSISLRAFSKFEYIDHGDNYGLAFWFAHPMRHYFFSHIPSIKLDEMQKEAKTKYGCDIFLPYFSNRTREALHEFIDAETPKSDEQDD